MSTIPHVSVVIPVYQSAESLKELAERLVSSLSILSDDFEVILVNDGSTDHSWDVIRDISSHDARFVGLRLSRNFGQHPAISAGLEYSRGTWVVVMDCDLQDRPEEIPNLYRKAIEGFEQVVARRFDRQDKWFKRTASRVYVRTLSQLSGREINPRVGNFGIYHRCVIDVVTSLREQGRTFGLLALWAGFRRTEIDVQHEARPYGRSSYSLGALIRLGLIGVISHSDRPLKLAIRLGAYLAVLSLSAGCWILFRQIVWSQSPAGWSSVMITLVLMTGLLLASIGVAGLYIAQIFEEVKGRPTSITWQTTRDSESDHL